ncbi:MAG: AbrB/MazE/SpoVT family DNA-binding domain-containing protein, partial [Caulobacteraceae bacterium]
MRSQRGDRPGRSPPASACTEDCRSATHALHFFERKECAMEAAITSKGQATIPKAVREHLHLRPGDRVRFFIHPDGSVALLPKVP